MSVKIHKFHYYVPSCALTTNDLIYFRCICSEICAMRHNQVFRFSLRCNKQDQDCVTVNVLVRSDSCVVLYILCHRRCLKVIQTFFIESSTNDIGVAFDCCIYLSVSDNG